MLSGIGQEGDIFVYITRKGDYMRLYVNKNEIPMLIEALECYISNIGTQTREAKDLIERIVKCDELQTTQKSNKIK